MVKRYGQKLNGKKKKLLTINRNNSRIQTGTTVEYEEGCNMEEQLRKEWDFVRNTLDINRVTDGSNKKVWWKCNKGHSWEASVKSRTAGRGCPYCAGKKVIEGVNDLATIYPEIAKEWDYERNSSIKPEDVLPRSHKKVWWIIDGKSKIEAIANRTINYEIKKAEKDVETIGGCKKVEKGVNDLATLYPDLASEWHSEKNGNLNPSDVLPTSSKKVWWKLNHQDDESGKEFKPQSILERLKGLNVLI